MRTAGVIVHYACTGAQLRRGLGPSTDIVCRCLVLGPPARLALEAPNALGRFLAAALLHSLHCACSRIDVLFV